MTTKQIKEIKEYIDGKFLVLSGELNGRLDTILGVVNNTFGDLETDRKVLNKLDLGTENTIKHAQKILEVLEEQTKKVSRTVASRVESTMGGLSGVVVDAAKETMEKTLNDFTSDDPKIYKKKGLIAKFKRFIKKLSWQNH